MTTANTPTTVRVPITMSGDSVSSDVIRPRLWASLLLLVACIIVHTLLWHFLGAGHPAAVGVQWLMGVLTGVTGTLAWALSKTSKQPRGFLEVQCWAGGQMRTQEVIFADAERDRLPTMWDGCPITWGYWEDGLTITHRPACPTCHSTTRPRYVFGTTIMSYLLLSRCAACGLDTVSEAHKNGTFSDWVLDITDYGPDGSWPLPTRPKDTTGVGRK